MRFNPIVEYVPGKQLVIADILSRKPLVSIKKAAGRPSYRYQTDPEMKSIIDFIANGWPSHECAVPHSVQTTTAIERYYH